MIDKIIIHNNAQSKAHAYINRGEEGLEIHEVKRKYEGALYIRVLQPNVDSVNLATKYAALIMDEANGDIGLQGYTYIQGFLPQNILTFDTSIHEQYWKMQDRDGKTAFDRWVWMFRNGDRHIPAPTEESLPFKVRAAVESVKIDDLVSKTEEAIEEISKSADTHSPPSYDTNQSVTNVVCGKDELWIDKKGNVNVRVEGSSDWVKTIPKFEPNIAP